MELFGSEYVIEYVIATHNERERDSIFRMYVTDMLKGIGETWGGEIKYRYVDLIKVEEPVKEEKSGDEIALEVIERAGLKGRT